MSQREIASTVRSLKHLAPAVYAATQTPAGADSSGFDAIGVLASIGAAGITLSGVNSITLQLQESDTLGSGYTNVANTDVVQPTSSMLLDDNTKANLNYRFDYIGFKRFIRLLVTFAGTHGTGTPIAINVLEGYPTIAPVTNA